MDAFENLPPLRDVIAAHGLRAEKKLGQNFLLDRNITDKIIRQAGDLSGKTVIEIGPGPGGLTRSLLRSAACKVIAVEFDARAVAALEDLKAIDPARLEIIQGDALHLDLLALSAAPRVIIANLPYNIATPLLVKWLQQIYADHSAYDEMILMFQKEVAERITASPGSKAYGRLSVVSQWLCDCKKLFDLPPSAFTPPPKVRSSIVRFTPKVLAPERPDFAAVEKVTAAAFGQRRKMLRSSLKDYAGHFAVLGIDPEKRAENLSVEEFLKLAKVRL